MSQLRQRYPEFAALGVALVTASPDDQAATRALVERLELPFPVLSDPDLAVIDTYGVRHDNEPSGRLIPRPAAFVIDALGRIRFAYKGDSVPDRPSEDVLIDVAREVIRGSGGGDAS